MNEVKGPIVIKRAKSIKADLDTPTKPGESEKAICDLLRVMVCEVLGGEDVAGITYLSGNSGTEYRITVPKNEIGRLLGQEGKTIRALRTVLFAAARVRGFRATLGGFSN